MLLVSCDTPLDVRGIEFLHGERGGINAALARSTRFLFIWLKFPPTGEALSFNVSWSGEGGEREGDGGEDRRNFSLWDDRHTTPCYLLKQIPRIWTRDVE